MTAQVKNNSKKIENSEQDVDVLYQKMGNTWYAFSIVNDDVFMAPISEEEINQIRGNSHEATRNQAA